MSLALKLDDYRNYQENIKHNNKLIDFIIDSTKPNKSHIIDELLAIIDEGDKALFQWFSKNGYNVSLDECNKIIDNKNNILKMDPLKAY